MYVAVHMQKPMALRGLLSHTAVASSSLDLDKEVLTHLHLQISRLHLIEKYCLFLPLDVFP